MGQNNKNSSGHEVELKELIYIFIKKKWVFITTSIVVLLAGIILTFLFTPQYNLISTVRITDNYSYYNDFLVKNFPEGTDNLWLYDNSKIGIVENKHLDTIAEELDSNSFLEKLKSNLGYDISKKQLKRAIVIERDTKNRTLSINTVYGDTEVVYSINKTLFELYNDINKEELSKAYAELVEELDSRSVEVLVEIDDLSVEVKENESVKEKLNSKNVFYNNLKDIKTILSENEEYFINRLELVKTPEEKDVEEYVSRKRYFIFSFFAAIALGIIAVFVANFFQSLKRK